MTLALGTTVRPSAVAANIVEGAGARCMGRGDTKLTGTSCRRDTT